MEGLSQLFVQRAATLQNRDVSSSSFTRLRSEDGLVAPVQGDGDAVQHEFSDALPASVRSVHRANVVRETVGVSIRVVRLRLRGETRLDRRVEINPSSFRARALCVLAL